LSTLSYAGSIGDEKKLIMWKAITVNKGDVHL